MKLETILIARTPWIEKHTLFN